MTESNTHGGGRGAGRERREDLAAARPARVGSYHILQELGRGGMGTVYLAEQREPVARQVALKILNREKETDRGRARFEAERQALALMNHPSIATVFEAGTTEDGRPFFAMELVRGEPITAFCDAGNRGLRSRLELFRQVCDAVQHAHQRMVIHRDLKPSNVLVAMERGKPVPKIIDFGIAKGADRPLVNREALKTRAGLPIGTPMYMSPEQIEGDALDARVDVYALGVLLYELMTGVLPLEPEDIEAFQLMLRVLKEDPPRPSDRYQTLDPLRRAEIAACRGTEPAGLRRQLRGDVDSIVMKAMEKDRRRRYGSAAELDADIDRLLRDEQVLATPPTLAYSVGKFVRRNTATVIVGAMLAVALVLGTVLSSVSMVRANRARDAARQAEQRASSTLEYLRGVLSAADPGVDGRQVRVVDLLAKASKMVETDLAGQPHVEASVRETIGLVLLELGVFDQSWPELERTVALQREELGSDHPATLHSFNQLGRLSYKLGRYQEAAQVHLEVFEKQQRILGSEDPETLWTMYHLAKALDKLGAWQQAESLYHENIEIRRRVLGPEHVDTLVAVNSLALFLGVRGMVDEAERLQRENLDSLSRIAGADHPDTLRAWGNLAAILNLRGAHDLAEALCAEAIPRLERVLGPEHPETLAMRSEMGVALRGLDRSLEAEAVDRGVLEARERTLGAGHPDTVDSRVQLGLDLLGQDRRDEAGSELTRAVASIRDALPPGHWRRALYEARLGRCLVALGRLEEAEQALLASWKVLEGQPVVQRREVVQALVELYAATDRANDAEHFRSLLAAL